MCEAIEDLFTKMTNGTPLRLEFVCLGISTELKTDNGEENILRISQDVLTNVLRHAQATLFRAKITFAPMEVNLDFSDNGCGFTVGTENNGFGLQGIKERIESMNGQLTVESAKGAEVHGNKDCFAYLMASLLAKPDFKCVGSWLAGAFVNHCGGMHQCLGHRLRSVP